MTPAPPPRAIEANMVLAARRAKITPAFIGKFCCRFGESVRVEYKVQRGAHGPGKGVSVNSSILAWGLDWRVLPPLVQAIGLGCTHVSQVSSVLSLGWGCRALSSASVGSLSTFIGSAFRHSSSAF